LLEILKALVAIFKDLKNKKLLINVVTCIFSTISMSLLIAINHKFNEVSNGERPSFNRLIDEYFGYAGVSQDAPARYPSQQSYYKTSFESCFRSCFLSGDAGQTDEGDREKSRDEETRRHGTIKIIDMNKAFLVDKKTKFGSDAKSMKRLYDTFKKYQMSLENKVIYLIDDYKILEVLKNDPEYKFLLKYKNELTKPKPKPKKTKRMFQQYKDMGETYVEPKDLQELLDNLDADSEYRER